MSLSPQLRLVVGVAILLILIGGALVSLMSSPEPALAPAKTLSPQVDHFLLALSWSPSYCREFPDADPRQCGAKKSFGYILRGLWAQGGSAPLTNCGKGNERVPPSVIDDMKDITPAAGLIGNQWRKHGICTGLALEDYFDLSRRAFERVVIPDEFRQPTVERKISPREVERAFMAANPGLGADMIGVTCSDENNIRDVRICLTPDLAFRSCRAARNECNTAQVSMPAVPR